MVVRRFDGPPSHTDFPPALDGTRPFGVHLRLSWWKPPVVILVPPALLLILQIVGFPAAGPLEGGDDPFAPTTTPLKSRSISNNVRSPRSTR